MMFKLPADSYFKLLGYGMQEIRPFASGDVCAVRRAWEELTEKKAQFDARPPLLHSGHKARPAVLSVWTRPECPGPWQRAVEIGELPWYRHVAEEDVGEA